MKKEIIDLLINNKILLSDNNLEFVKEYDVIKDGLLLGDYKYIDNTYEYRILQYATEEALIQAKEKEFRGYMGRCAYGNRKDNIYIIVLIKFRK